ncbi:tRNA pseudouridine(55) synthase TruB [Rhodobacteraceae bacterium DSL-40]|uniref:tRNA pseudouridine(55) synthase TruB n=1 Tax=Amaricoccus sp. B4 TaxID=3368557 RepID=UPI000DABD40F
MARRKKGRPVHGWLILDKPAGLTSATAVAAARRALDARKAGHAGTLDPAATGLLAIAFGEATKTVPHVTDARKAYRFTVRWGAATQTDDAEGEVIATSDVRPTEAAILAALPSFRGDILQVPPQVSAVKIDGERAYALARAGETVEIAPRPLHVERLDLIAFPDPDTAEFELVCGKGGYVRSIARDLGSVLGSYGHVVALRRLWSGPFALEDAVSWREIEIANAERGGAALEDRLLPVEAALAGLPAVDCPDVVAVGLGNGNPQPLPRPEGVEEGDALWVRREGRPLAVGRWQAGIFCPDRVFVFE